MKPLPCLVLSVLSAWSILSSPVDAAPAGQWSFDETSGTTAADSSGNGRNAAIFGSPSWVGGNTNGALHFNGTTTYGKVPDSPAFDGTDKLTISCWVKPEGLDGSARFIVSKRSGVNVNCSYSLFFYTGRKLFVDLNLNGSVGDRIESRAVFENDRWYHLMLVYDGSGHPSQRVRLYVDGKLDRQAAAGSSSIPDHPSDLFIGNAHQGSSSKFNGAIDELSIRRELPSEAEIAEFNRGTWAIERWDEMNFTKTEELVREPRFYGPPQAMGYLNESGKNLDWKYQAGRTRGTIEVPVSGNYVFWVSGRSALDLMLSEDASPFRKKRVARLSPLIGTGSGIRHSTPNRWDQFDSQMSRPIPLEVGVKYYIEVIQQTSHSPESHIHLAWAPQGGTRTPIPPESMGYYVIPPNDLDDDSLPDDWEQSHGLDKSDNGAVDLVRQGEHGDFDGDGLTNHEEYLLGTNPALRDTDGDGVSDLDESRSLGTNPLVSDLPAETIVATLDLEQYEATDEWMILDGGLLSENFRGVIEWDFSTPTDGIWIIQADTRLRGKVYDNEEVDVNVSIDGRFLGRHVISYGTSHESLLRIVTPRLGSGGHTLKLEIDNDAARRTVQIKSIDVREPSGPDADADGVPDWVETLLGRTDAVASHGATSRISPFCLEGQSRLAGEVLVNDRLVEQGTDDSHWFTNLPLDAVNGTPYEVKYASGLSTVGTVFWQPTNVFDGGSIPVRAGDSLKIGAWTSEGTGTSQVTVSQTSFEPVVTGPFVREQTDVAFRSGAGRFTGNVHNRIAIADSDDLDGTGKLTIAFRAKPSATCLDGLPRGIVSKRVASNNETAYSAFIFTGGRLFVDLDAGQGSPTRIDTGYTMTQNWQSVAVVFDGTVAASQRVKVYVDGVLKKTASLSAASLRNRASDLSIGSLNSQFSYGGGPCSFDGLLDDVRVSRTALTAAEVLALHQTGERIAETVAWLDFEDGTHPAADTGAQPLVHPLSGMATFVQLFEKAHSYTINAVHDEGGSGRLVVTVPDAELPETTTVLQNTLRYWTLDATKADPSLVFQPGANLRLGEREVIDPNSYRYGLYPLKGGRLGVTARLWRDGPIAAIGQLNSIGLSGALKNDLVSEGQTDFQGYRVIVSPVLVTGLPPGGKIKITIFREGIYFEDGSTVKTFTAADLENGMLYLRLLEDTDTEGGFCHYMDIYDASGALLARH